MLKLNAMSNIKQNTDDWNPFYVNYKDLSTFPVFKKIFYEKSWFCNESKIIHTSKKQYINCIYCNSDNDREQYLKLINGQSN